MAGVVRETDEAVKATKMEELKSETIPFYLEKLDATAKENNGYLALGQVKRLEHKMIPSATLLLPIWWAPTRY